MKYLVSLCIPTNGVTEWVLPVMESIYNQNIDEQLFQVVVADNGDNKDFAEAMDSLCSQHTNITYKKTSSMGFLNQIESFRLADGELIKFVNHRMPLVEGTLKKLIDFSNKYSDKKPVVYFSNGKLDLKESYFCNKFDSFVKKLSYWSSWSAGLALWHDDIEKVDKISEFNSLFPHTDILFLNKNSTEYIIDNRVLMQELPTDDTKKGKYNLFHAFAVEYPKILRELLNSNFISENTFNDVMSDLKVFLGQLYFKFIILKRPCSYDLTDADQYIATNFSVFNMKIMALPYFLSNVIKNKIFKKEL